MKWIWFATLVSLSEFFLARTQFTLLLASVALIIFSLLGLILA